MNLIEFIKHPAYNYYITTLVHDCLLSDLTNVFDYNLLKYIIMTIDCENSDLIRLSNLYDIDWKTNNTFKDKNIKDITVKDYNNYIKNNKQ